MLSLKKNVKRLFKKKKTLKHEKLYSFTLFACFCFRLLWLWFVFLDSVSVLRFNFVFFLVCFLLGCLLPLWDLCFCFLVVFFCFGFAFCLMCFCFVCFSVLGFRFVLCVSVLFVFLVCPLLFLLLLMSCGFSVSVGHPIYLKVLCI